MTVVRLPATHPCGSCPYRRDVPSGVWHPDEYVKLPPYDQPTPLQPAALFMCHQADGRLCAGWTGCHDMNESLAVRLAARNHGPAFIDALLDYTTTTPLFETGAEAASHGLALVHDPDENAVRVIDKLRRKRDR